MPPNVANAIVFIINTLAQLYLFVLLIRLWLPWVGGDFRNPIAQAILKLTSPVIIPVRRIIPPIGRLDTATVLVAYIIQYLTIVVLLLILGVQAGLAAVALTALVNLVLLSLRLFAFAIIVRVVLSWLAPAGYNPAIAMINTLTESILPPMGGLDLSPLFAIILLMAAAIIVAGFKPLGI